MASRSFNEREVTDRLPSSRPDVIVPETGIHINGDDNMLDNVGIDNNGYSEDDVIAVSNDFKADGGKILMIVIDHSTQQTHTELASNDKSGNQLLWNDDLNKLDEIRKVVEETIGSVYQSGCLI